MHLVRRDNAFPTRIEQCFSTFGLRAGRTGGAGVFFIGERGGFRYGAAPRGDIYGDQRN